MLPVALLAFARLGGEFEELPNKWYTTLYDVLFTGSVLLVAPIAATVPTTCRSLQRVLQTITPGNKVQAIGLWACGPVLHRPETLAIGECSTGPSQRSRPDVTLASSKVTRLSRK